jgi:multidrug efflux pump subunit AcrA (membrane-fusion protein)
MKVKNKPYIIAVILAVLGAGYYFYQKNQTGTGTTRYVTSTVEKSTLVTSVSGSGNVIVGQIANVDPTIGGTVANLSVAVGDSVKKGQLLFTIDNDQLGVSADQSAASLEQA